MCAALLADDEFVIRRAACVVACGDGQRSLVAQQALAPPYDVFVKGRGGKIPEDTVDVVNVVPL